MSFFDDDDDDHNDPDESEDQPAVETDQDPADTDERQPAAPAPAAEPLGLMQPAPGDPADAMMQPPGVPRSSGRWIAVMDADALADLEVWR